MLPSRCCADNGMVAKPEGQLQPQQHQQHDVAGFGVGADTVVAQTAVQQQAHTDEAEHAKESTRHHGHELLVARADEVLVQEVRGQHAKGVAEEQEQHTDVEQVAAPAQLARTQ